MAVHRGSFADAGLKEILAFADPTLNISEQAVSERYTLGDEIGCGSYGRAVLAHRKEDGLQVVIKQISLLDMDDKARLVRCAGFTWVDGSCTSAPKAATPTDKWGHLLHLISFQVPASASCSPLSMSYRIR